ncbi:hypothetical protein [Nitrosomonas sp.]|uniref:hypothetical protein n=1 Tax=Nitrosomonas sp. TaxID=42353 RepID=UPI001DB24391|nr:hypothetical protein [Nitrosomonas sp.]MBX3617497.1 hypothetical protein [Nitrosomonas sp.]
MPKPIPATALNALKSEAGIDDVVVMLCIDKTGKVHQLKGANVNGSDQTAARPLTTTTAAVQTISMIQHTDQPTLASLNPGGASGGGTPSPQTATRTCITVIIGGASVTYCW